MTHTSFLDHILSSFFLFSLFFSSFSFSSSSFITSFSAEPSRRYPQPGSDLPYSSVQRNQRLLSYRPLSTPSRFIPFLPGILRAPYEVLPRSFNSSIRFADLTSGSASCTRLFVSYLSMNSFLSFLSFRSSTLTRPALPRNAWLTASRKCAATQNRTRDRNGSARQALVGLRLTRS
jgi:hypothetical protein